MENGEELPKDILSHILSLARESPAQSAHAVNIQNSICSLGDLFHGIFILYAETNETADMELLVDDFVTFFIAGAKYFLLYVCIHVNLSQSTHMSCD